MSKMINHFVIAARQNRCHCMGFSNYKDVSNIIKASVENTVYPQVPRVVLIKASELNW